MKIFTCKDFKGHWPVPVAAVIVAADESHARFILGAELAVRGLPPADFTLQEMETGVASIRVLSDGEY